MSEAEHTRHRHATRGPWTCGSTWRRLDSGKAKIRRRIRPIRVRSCSRKLDLTIDSPHADKTKDAIASLPHLDALRMFNLPIIKYDQLVDDPHGFAHVSREGARLCRFVLQKFADQVLQYLISHGSPGRILVVRPDENRDEIIEEDVKDPNSHQWPSYAYTRGRTVDTREIATFVAVPLENVRLELNTNRSETNIIVF
jgi:hypothetical protein